MTLTIGSLFAGYGGIDLALHAVLGAETKWVCEWDDAPSKILAHHWPDVPNYRDVTQIDWSEVPPVDIICGGSPCQDLSAAGKRAGMTEGTRSNLWVSMREAIATIRPRLVVWENVQGALSATATSDSDMEPGQGPMGGGMGRGGYLRALGRVLGDLAEIGFDAQWTTVRASDVGAPHHRARVFLIAYPADSGCVVLQAGQLREPVGPEIAGADGGVGSLPDDLTHLPTPTVADGDRERNNPAQARRHSPPLSATLAHFQTPRVSDANGGGAHGDGGPDLRTAIADLPHLPTPVAQPSGNSPEDHLRKKPGRKIVTDLAVLVENDLMKSGGKLDHLPTPQAHDAGGGKTPEQIAAMRARGHGVSNLNETAEHELHDSPFGKYAPVVHRWEQATGMEAPAPTELNRNGKPRLNAAFAEWMMGLPAGWITDVPGVTRAQQLKAAGNGVCPQQAAAALRHLLETR